ncbi:hypothetical protein ACIOG8_37880 [Streptomyces erythrochromogenes]|uniref:hypothetical protein n=1 Tax=Streptomyces erythrochromogenes TaxID=285574 RepID=UPI003810DF97
MTYPPQPEPFAEALAEAAQTAAMAYRLVMTINDTVRRAIQKRLTGREEELGEDAARMAPGWSSDQLRGVIGDDILADLMQGADWPHLSHQLVGLQQAGVDLGAFLPQMGRMTAGVHQAVAANIARTKAEGTDRWTDLLKATMPEGVVRDAILASPAWPDIAAQMGRLDARGIDVARILPDAHRAGAGVDQAVAAVTTAAAQAPSPAAAPAAGKSAPAAAPAAPAAAVDSRVPAQADARVPAPAAVPTAAPAPAPAPAPAAPVQEAVDPWAPPASRDAKRSWGPLTEGLEVPRDLDLGDRAKALEQLGVKTLAHATIVGLVKDVLPETQVGLLVSSRPWPLLAHRMNQIREQGGPAPLGAHLARLKDDTSFKEAAGAAAVGRLVDAPLNCLRHRPRRRPRPPPAPGSPRRRPAPAPPRHPPPRSPGSRPRRKARSPRTGSRPDRPGARGVPGSPGWGRARWP